MLDGTASPVVPRDALLPPAAVTVGASALTPEGPRRSGDGGAGGAPPTARAGGAEAGRPPHVLRGSTWSACLDWVRATGPHHPSYFADVQGVLARWLNGPGEVGKGLHHYSESVRWSEGASLHFGGNNGTYMLEATGGLLSQWEVGRQLRLLRAAYARGGLSCTRLDVAIDIRNDHPSRLIPRMVEACEAGYLRRPRSWSPISNNDRTDRTGEGVYLGSRQSEVVVRVYDKGLETKTAPRGSWLRVEGEFKGERAAAVGSLIQSMPDEGFAPLAVSLVFGAVEFKDDNYNVPRFWAELTAGIEMRRLTTPRPASSFGGFRDQAYKSVGRRLARAAHQLGISVGEAAARFFAGVSPEEPGRVDLVQAGLLMHLSGGVRSDIIPHHEQEEDD